MVLCWVSGSAATEALVCGQVGAAFDPRRQSQQDRWFPLAFSLFYHFFLHQQHRTRLWRKFQKRKRIVTCYESWMADDGSKGDWSDLSVDLSIYYLSICLSVCLSV